MMHRKAIFPPLGKIKVKSVVFAFVMLLLFLSPVEAEEFTLVLPVGGLDQSTDAIVSIKKKFPALEYLDVSMARQGAELQVGPLESESLAQALATEFSAEGFQPKVVSATQLQEQLLQVEDVVGNEPEPIEQSKAREINEVTEIAESGGEAPGPEAVSSTAQATGDVIPSDALEAQEGGASILNAAEKESEAVDSVKSQTANVPKVVTVGGEALRLQAPFARQAPNADELLGGVDLTDLDAPALDLDAAVSGAAPLEPQAISPDSGVFADENYLLLDLVLDGVILAQNFVAYAPDEGTYLPLAVFLRNVGFAISIDSDLNSATGWFIDEERTFTLNRKDRIVVVEGNELVLEDMDVVDDGYNIYVSEYALNKWFPVKMEVSINSLTATVVPTEELPIQKLFSQNKALRNRVGPKVVNEMRDLDYAFFEPSAAEIIVTEKYTKADGKDGKFKDNVIAEYSGDLAYFNTNVYATGAIDSKDDHLDTLRFLAKRIDPEKKMFGPLKASEIHLGDVNTVNFVGKGAGGSVQRGAYLSNFSLTNEARYDSATISGNSLPDWDVELYQNDRLIDSQKVGDNGKYEFSDAELFYGQNVFVIKKFGPHGEHEQEVKKFNVTRNSIPVGEMRYELSLTQQNAKAIEIKDTKSTKDSGNISGAIKADIGLTPLSYLTLGLESETIKNVRHNYAHLGATHSFEDYANLHIEGQVDSHGGQMAQGVLQTGISPFSVSLSHREHFDEFEFPVIRRTSVSISPTIELPWEDASLATSFTGTMTENQNATSQSIGNTLTLNLFKNVWGSNSLTSTSDGEQQKFFDSVKGEAFLRARYPNANNTLWGEFEVSGSTKYNLGSSARINSYEVNLFDKWRLTDSVSFFAQYAHTQTDSPLKSTNVYGVGLFIEMGELSITPAISYSDAGVLQAGAQFSLPLAINPRNLKPQYEDRNPTTSSGVSALVFLDKNYNYVYDSEDEPLEDVAITVYQFGRRELTDSSGMALIHGLPPNLPVDISIESGKKWSSSWVTMSMGEAIYPRPGKTYLIDFPVQSVSELDGTVMLVDGATTEPIPSVPLELVRDDGEVVAETASEHDGFFLFDRVIPGKYFIRPKPDFLRARDLYALPSEIAEATPAGDYLQYMDIYLSPTKRDLVMHQSLKFSDLSEELSVAGSFSSYEEAKEAGGMLSEVQPSGIEVETLSETQLSKNQTPQTFIHVESYKDLKVAEKAIASLYENHSILSNYGIMALRNDVIGKGIYYRVVVAAPTVKDARKLSAYFKKIGKYANVVNI